MTRFSRESPELTMICEGAATSTTYYPLGTDADGDDEGVTTNVEESVFADPFEFTAVTGAAYTVADTLTDGSSNVATVTNVGPHNATADTQRVEYRFTAGTAFSGTVTGSSSGATGVTGTIANGKVCVITGMVTFDTGVAVDGFRLQDHTGAVFDMNFSAKANNTITADMALRCEGGFRMLIDVDINVGVPPLDHSGRWVLIRYVMKDAKSPRAKTSVG